MTNNLQNKLDEDFQKIGEFGPYQLLIFILVGLTACIPAMLAYGYVFIGATPEFRCRIPELPNDTFEISNSDGTFNKTTNKFNNKEYGKCSITNFTQDTYFTKCDSWIFSKVYYGKTIVTDWNLLCDNAAKKSTFETLYFIGTYGVLFSGILSDKLGRKFCAYVFIIANAIVSVLMAVVINVNFSLEIKEIIYGILRFLTGITSNTYSVAVVLAIEITGPSYRVIAANSIYYFYIFGEYLTVFLSFFVRDYAQLYIWIAGFMCIFPLYFWIVPESPRWLLTNQKHNEANKILERIAKSNKKEIPDAYNSLLFNEDSDKNKVIMDNDPPLGFFQTLVKILKSKKLFVLTVSLALNWLTNNLVYYGLTLGTGQLAGNPYLNFTLLATTELLSIISSQIVLEKYGRKVPYIINMTITGVSLLIVYFVQDIPILITVLAIIGKFTISFTYNGVYIMTSELYPTVIRTTAIAFCQCVARLGAVIAPSINLVGELYWKPFPFIIYGAFATASSILTFFFIPETRHKSLTDTLN